MPDEHIKTRCCVVGGGPAGMMTGLLFARAGVETVVIEKHSDFLRDFRGDTVHPSTTELLAELGMLERFLKIPHDQLGRLGGEFGNERITVADFSGLPTCCKYIAFMPQWDFLNFLASEASAYPEFSLRMETKATDILESEGRVTGVQATTPEGTLEIKADLVIAADGRSSRMRECAGLKVNDIGAPIDALWFKIPRKESEGSETLFHAGPGQVVITINRGTYWQCAYVVPKGEAEKVTGGKLSDFRASVSGAAPVLKDAIESLESFENVRLLKVAIDRLEQWSRPGLLMIGDAAHAMSPIGGVGINLAVQDAVAAANFLAEKLQQGNLNDSDLKLIQKRRLFPAKLTQWFQVQAQNRILKPIISDKESIPGTPLFFRIISRFPALQRKMGSAIGLGARPEHIRTPEQSGES